MHELASFRRRHPHALIGRPAIALVIVATAATLSLAVGSAALAAAQLDGDPAVAVVASWIALSSATAAVALRHKLFEVLRLWWRGAASYAIGEDELLLVDRDGGAVLVELSCIAALELERGEPRLRITSEQPGRVYRTMFALFDDDFDGPDAERFFEGLAMRLRERSSSALVARHEASEQGI